MKIIILFFAVFFIALFSSCDKENNTLKDLNVLSGTWRDSVVALPRGYYINELKVMNNSTFTSKGSSYGIYNGQSANDLTGWFEYSGTFTLNSNNINFTSHKFTSWDSFYVGSQPQTKIQDQIIFENCTFKIEGEILEINYTTYPADAPVNTMRQYKRIK
jgi:hypothetical protein